LAPRQIKNYPYVEQDVVKIHLPSGFSKEGAGTKIPLCEKIGWEHFFILGLHIPMSFFFGVENYIAITICRKTKKFP